eukprot:1278217-Rhodomonas_salina.1
MSFASSKRQRAAPSKLYVCKIYRKTSRRAPALSHLVRERDHALASQQLPDHEGRPHLVRPDVVEVL